MSNNSNHQDEEIKNIPTNYKLSYSVGVSENTNKKYRPTMEDVHTYVENFVERLDWGYFAIFDGHAGQQAAKWCGQNLHSILEKKLLDDENEDVRDILNQTFVEADSQIVSKVKGSSGCTAAVAVIRWELPDINDVNNNNSSDSTTENEKDSNDNNERNRQNSTTTTTSTTSTQTTSDQSFSDQSKQNIDLKHHKRMLYTANVGDTRIVLYRNNKAIRLTYDHKASDRYEINRIEKSGGLIMKSRVNGMLAVTRSLGDQFFKDLVIGNPYTTSVELNYSTDKFLIIACDGLWDVITDQQACELIKDIHDVDIAAKTLVDSALAKLTTDNITVMVIRFD